MSKLRKLSKTVDDIRNTAEKILSTAAPIAEDLLDKNSEFIEEFLDEFQDVTSLLAKKSLQSTILNLISDAEIVENEIDVFEEVVCNGEDAILSAEGCE